MGQLRGGCGAAKPVRCKAKCMAQGGQGHVGMMPREGIFAGVGGGDDTPQVLARSGHYPLNALIFIYIYMSIYIYSVYLHTHTATHTHTQPSPTAWPRAALAPLLLAAANQLLPIKSAYKNSRAQAGSSRPGPVPSLAILRRYRCWDDARWACWLAHSRSPSSLLPPMESMSESET